MKNRSLPITLLAIAFVVFPVLAHAGAKITIINQDPAGVGFNDTTAANPIGGNTGTTVGQQRLIAFEKAAEIWGDILDSDVEIRIQAKFSPLECETNSGVLGSAGPRAIESDHPGAPVAGTWYHIALANRQAGEDRDLVGNDIQAQFNGDLGKPGCLTGLSWYYGLDGLAPANSVDLLVVLLHEFAHGLGFSELINDSNGSFCCENSNPVVIQPDAYSRFIRDNVSGLNFIEMSNSQRRAALTSGGLVWTGDAVFEKAPDFLDLEPGLQISSPSAIAGNYFATGAVFGGSIADGPFTGRLVLAEDASNSEGQSTTDACTMILNQSAVAGNLAVVDRGTCPFVTKALNVQDAGAIGMIVVQNIPDEAPFTMGGDDPSVSIPLIMISSADGTTIKAQLANDVRGSIQGGPGMAGTDETGRIFLYAPRPFEPGSSTSHWDVTASPNLLMEPSINQDLGVDVDLTEAHFRDIGWFAPATVEIDLTAEVTSQPTGPAKPGDTIRYLLDISQVSGSAATSVLVKTSLDPNVALVAGSVVPTKGDVLVGNESGDQTVEVSIGGLKPEEFTLLRFDVVIDTNVPPGTSEVRSSATVTGTNFDSITESVSNEVASNPMNASKTVSLALDADESGGITPGDTVRYAIALQNSGTEALTNVVLTDVLDENLSTVQIVSTSSGEVTSGSTAGEGTVVWEVPLVAGGVETLVFDVILSEDTPSRVTFVLNQAQITGTGFEPTVTDNPATEAALDATGFGVTQARKRTTRR
jgi:uncharacterized repeat protein (TIGR01451 family)